MVNEPAIQPPALNSSTSYYGRVHFFGAIIASEEDRKLISLEPGELNAPSMVDGNSTAREIKCWTTLSGLNPFGQVSSATLQIKAKAKSRE
jgi:hypothetical protein